MKKTNKAILTILMAMVVTFILPVAVKAATYSYSISGSTRSISCVNGETTLDVNGKTFTLTKPLVAADVALDSNGTAWILFKNGAVYWWSYELQGNSGEVKLMKYISNGLSFVVDSNKFITGIKTSTGTTKILTYEEQKNQITSSSGNNSGNNSSSSNNNSGNNSGNSGNNNSGNNSGNNGNSGNTNTGNNNNSGNTNTGNNSSSGNTNSGNTGNGSNGSTNTGNSNINGSSSTGSNNSNSNNSSTNNGSVNNSSTTTNTNTNNTSTTTSKSNKKATRVIPKGKYRYKMYSGKTFLASYTLKNGVLNFHGWKLRNVAQAGFVKSSKNLVVITKSGKAYSYNYNTLNKKALYDFKKYGKAVSFCQDKNGFVTHVVTKKPRRINVKKK